MSVILSDFPLVLCNLSNHVLEERILMRMYDNSLNDYFMFMITFKSLVKQLFDIQRILLKCYLLVYVDTRVHV